ncbi:MAG: 8-oxoguanine DNA glycosylase [Lachnospiraceae bacterium]|jgi:N-glycosylase/DNA lyase|nr:8-oxoguanine DNA glycosylase [Lachnospiraceae bacterium]
MTELWVQDFDIGQISRSGQCFRLNLRDDGHYGLVALGRYLELWQDGERLCLSCETEEWEQVWKNYFDWDTDYGAVKAAVALEDTYMREACRAGGGIRILRQELWETLASFILSGQNNIPRIKKCVESLCEHFGEPFINFRGETCYGFPTASRLAALDPEELSPCRLGYRSGYIWKSAGMASSGEVDLVRLKKLSCEEARKELMRFRGVGKKVADCVCLFALHHIGAFPVDTHIEDMLREHYPQGFPFERYEGVAGILQQYGFYYELYGKNRERGKM